MDLLDVPEQSRIHPEPLVAGGRGDPDDESRPVLLERQYADEGADRRREGYAWIGDGVDGLVDLAADDVEEFVGRGFENVLLRSKVIIERAEADIGGLGDVIDGRRVCAFRRHHRHRGLNESGAGLLFLAGRSIGRLGDARAVRHFQSPATARRTNLPFAPPRSLYPYPAVRKT